jgi:hypothetical protein
MPYAKRAGGYVWPFAAVRDPASLSRYEISMLSTIYPDMQRELESWVAYGDNVGWRPASPGMEPGSSP